ELAPPDQRGERTDNQPVQVEAPSRGGVGGVDARFRGERGPVAGAAGHGPQTERDRHAEEVAESYERRGGRDRRTDRQSRKEFSKRKVPARNTPKPEERAHDRVARRRLRERRGEGGLGTRVDSGLVILADLIPGKNRVEHGAEHRMTASPSTRCRSDRHLAFM